MVRWAYIGALLGMLCIAEIATAQASLTRSSGPVLREYRVPLDSGTLRGSDHRIVSMRTPRIGLVLSGGGARGLAQVGVIRALEEAGIRPDCIVGTSIGSVVGGLYATGYSATRLNELVRTLDWDQVLQLGDGSDRRSLTAEQKPASDRSVLTLRFDGLQPVLPLAVSNGQRLTNMLNELVLQGLYHSNDFDSLAIPFRAVATDLYTGKRVVLEHGSLAEALRASASIPVMYTGVAMDSMLLVDGGLVSNIPTDVARAMGCDLIIVVNTSSPLRDARQINNALETLDQVFNITMGAQSAEQLRDADIVISPALGGMLATRFDLRDSLLAAGYAAGLRAVPEILHRIRTHVANGSGIDDPDCAAFASLLPADASMNILPITRRCALREVLDSCIGINLSGEQLVSAIRLVRSGDDTHYDLLVHEYPRITGIEMQGVTLLGASALSGIESRWRNQRMSHTHLRQLREYVLEEYRMRGYSLARIEQFEVNSGTGVVTMRVSEGRIARLAVEGNTRTDQVVILRELPLNEGEVFRISQVRAGLQNLNSLQLFHHVTFDLSGESDNATMTIRVIERPSQMLQLGVLVDNERNAQFGVVLRDANIFGTGTELSGSFLSGSKNRNFTLEYRTNRLFYTPFSLTGRAYAGFRDYNFFEDVAGVPRTRYERAVTSVYRRIAYGATAALGLNLQRFGALQGTFRIEQQELRSTEFRTPFAEAFTERHFLASVGLTATVDTKDRYSFPRRGVLFQSSYTSAQAALGSEVSFSRLYASYEFWAGVGGDVVVLHPHLAFGYGDKSMPLTEEFRLGGLQSVIGMRENEFTGRQIITAGMELRYTLPFDILFESHVSLRYDLGRTWEEPELVRLSDLRHGAGLLLGLDTPIGPALFGIGKSFYFVRNNPETPVKFGPTSMYFSIGVELE
ncbi:MAG TPA: BamA/TamA family outer membrane protein [Bacteroidota bacterium]|nr:BamA/TamA family outer membrane protein [Bacteroidota bacterium]